MTEEMVTEEMVTEEMVTEEMVTEEVVTVVVKEKKVRVAMPITAAIAEVSTTVEQLKTSASKVMQKMFNGYMTDENKVSVDGVTVYVKGGSFHVLMYSKDGVMVVAHIVQSTTRGSKVDTVRVLVPTLVEKEVSRIVKTKNEDGTETISDVVETVKKEAFDEYYASVKNYKPLSDIKFAVKTFIDTAIANGDL